jgi:ABC-type uncharacterized transport system permease subunit
MRPLSAALLPLLGALLPLLIALLTLSPALRPLLEGLRLLLAALRLPVSVGRHAVQQKHNNIQSILFTLFAHVHARVHECISARAGMHVRIIYALHLHYHHIRQSTD